MSVPAELHYTEEHEWVSIDGDTATIGITDYAAQLARRCGVRVAARRGGRGDRGRAVRRGRVDQVGERPVLPRGWRGHRG